MTPNILEPFRNTLTHFAQVSIIRGSRLLSDRRGSAVRLLVSQRNRNLQTSSIRSISSNKKRLDNKSSLNRTGLFGIHELDTPEGFHTLRDNALKQAQRLVDEIVFVSTNENKNQHNQNVVALFDELSNCLCKVADLAEFIRVGHPNDRFRTSAEQASIAISTLVEKLNTDRRLYDALKGAKFDDELDDFVAKLFMFDFEQSAIHLDEKKRRTVLELNESILKLGSIFAANANQPRLVDINKLPPNTRGLFMNNHSNLFTSNQKLSISGLQADSSNELVRETAYKLYLQPDETQDDILTNLLKCRQTLARLCGFKSYAHRAVNGSIAGSPEVVMEFLDILNDRIRDLASKDYEQMLALKMADKQARSKDNIRLNAWDVPYYSASYKRGIYHENILQCMPYFSINSCLEGLNMIFQKLYGVKMNVDSCSMGEIWHDDVMKMSIIDEGTNSLLGYIYCDLFERQMKQHQDCHHTIRGGCYLRDGSYQLPIVVLVMSLPDGQSNDNPSLLSPSMVENLFHEMGHAMHSMMAATKYQHITGTRCSTDLAEVPSILMEFFASDPRVVKQFARHHKTGERMPDELMRSWIRAKKVFIASETQLQIFYAALDQAYHSEIVCDNNLTTTDILARIQSQYYSIPYVEKTAWQLRFSHLVGYGAKYYSYLVSRAVAGAIWSKLFAEEPLSRKAGLKFKEEVLAHGGGKQANKIAEEVLGCKVDANFIANSVITSFKQPFC